MHLQSWGHKNFKNRDKIRYLIYLKVSNQTCVLKGVILSGMIEQHLLKDDWSSVLRFLHLRHELSVEDFRVTLTRLQSLLISLDAFHRCWYMLLRRSVIQSVSQRKKIYFLEWMMITSSMSTSEPHAQVLLLVLTLKLSSNSIYTKGFSLMMHSSAFL